MATFTPPIATKVVPRFTSDSTLRQRALFKYMRPLDRACNVYVCSDGTVVTDYSIILSDGSFSSTAIPYPIVTGGLEEMFTIGPPEGAEGGPYGEPPPYAAVADGTSGVQVYTAYDLSVYLKYWFAGAHGPYVGISSNLVTILTAAKFDNYIA